MGCKFKFPDESLCGLPIFHTGNTCQFHHYSRDNIKINTGHYIDIFNWYVMANKGKVLYLNGLKFEDSNFDQNRLSEVTSINLSNTKLKKCIIDCNLPFEFKNIQFENCTFKNIEKVRKFDNCSFYLCNFSSFEIKNCEFNQCSFTKLVLINTNFTDCEFIDGTFNELSAVVSLTFKNVTFTGTNFSKSTINQTSFINCDFNNLNNIKEITFSRCIFSNIKFVSIFEDIKFDNCEFGSRTLFAYSRFTSTSPIFNNVNFNGSNDDNYILSFARCKVASGSSFFDNCTIRGGIIDFANLDLKCDNFYIESTSIINLGYRAYETIRVINVERINFYGLKFKGHFKLEQIGELIGEGIDFSLENVDFDNMESSRIINISFAITIFKNSTIENLKFHNCLWDKDNGFNILYDEKSMDTKFKENFPNKELLKLYVQLKKNFEASRNMIDAGDWYYREMETRRRILLEESTNKVKNRVRYILKSTYKFISSYGENYLKPFSIIVGLWVLFSLFHLFNGFALTDNNYIYYDSWVVNNFSIYYFYDYLGSFLYNFYSDYIYDFLRALLYNFTNIILPFKKGTKFIDETNVLLTNLQFLLMVILIPLFLLALRRKFRR